MTIEQDSRPFDVHDPVNVGNSEEFTMQELASEVGRAVGRELKIRYCPLPADDPRQRRPDLMRAKELLGWSPKIPFVEGIKKTVEYFASRIGSVPLAQTAHD